MWAGATSMPGGLGREDHVGERRPAVGEHVGHRSLDGVEVDAEPGRQVCLRIHVDAQDPVALFGERPGQVDRRRRLADAAFLVGDRDHVGHRGITSNLRADARPSGQGSEWRPCYPAGAWSRTPVIHTLCGVVHRILWISGTVTSDARSDRDGYDGPVLAQRQSDGSVDVSTNEERLDRSSRCAQRSVLGGGAARIDEAAWPAS